MVQAPPKELLNQEIKSLNHAFDTEVIKKLKSLNVVVQKPLLYY